MYKEFIKNLRQGNFTKDGKVDKRRTYIAVIDTETCLDKKIYGEDNIREGYVYDVGWTICDKKGNVYQTRSFLVEETFAKRWDLMTTCYFANKIPMYLNRVANKQITIKPWSFIIQEFRRTLKEFNCTIACAHNMGFDYKVLRNTCKYVGGNPYFFPYGIELWDTMRMWQTCIANRPTYKAFCEMNGFLTAKYKRPQSTAEAAYAYITSNPDFTEEHTALADTLIEAQILAYCFRQHKKMRRLAFNPK